MSAHMRDMRVVDFQGGCHFVSSRESALMSPLPTIQLLLKPISNLPLRSRATSQSLDGIPGA